MTTTTLTARCGLADAADRPDLFVQKLPRRRGWFTPTGQRLWRYLLAILIVALR